MTPDAQKTKPIAPARKPYQPPRLEVYGDLSAITQSNATGFGKNDSAMTSNKT